MFWRWRRSILRKGCRNRRLWVLGAGITLASELLAVPIAVPNASFETPTTSFVNTHIDSWQKTAMPESYDTNGGFTWDQLAGIFANTDVSRPDHIDNCDGAQAMWIFAVPEIGVFQDYDSMDWSHTNSPPHDFNALFEVGKAYQLTVGIIGGGGGMPPGASLELSLYYRDSQSNFVVLAATNITNSTETFPTTTHFVDFSVSLPVVQPSDTWAWQNIGIRILSTVVDTNLAGGYWDIDNVRLNVRNPVLSNPMWTNGQFQFTLQSDPGLRFQILGSSDPSLPRLNWMILSTVTNLTGNLLISDPAAGFAQRFYQAQELP